MDITSCFSQKNEYIALDLEESDWSPWRKT